jgi:hypothetical protein
MMATMSVKKAAPPVPKYIVSLWDTPPFIRCRLNPEYKA